MQQNDTKSGAEIDQPLTHFTKYESLDPDDSINILFAVQPGADVSQVTVVFELYDIDKEKIVAEETATWSQSLLSMSFTGIADGQELEDDDAVQFRVQNDGDEVNTDDIELHLASTNGVEFALNGTKGADITESLTTILGGSSMLVQSAQTSDITLKLDKDNSQTNSEITLQLKKGGQVLVEKKLKWSQSLLSMSFTGIADGQELKDNDAIQFKVQNDGDEVNTDDIELHLASTNGVEFDLNGTKGAGITESLMTILGGSSMLVQSAQTSDITLKLDKDNRQTNSEITLQLKKGDQVLVEKKLKWSQSLLSMSFTGIADGQELKDNAAVQFKVQNDGDEVNTDDIELHLASTNGVEFDLNGTKGAGITESLTTILGGSSMLVQSAQTSDITLKLDKDNSQTNSEITLQLKKGGQVLGREKIEMEPISTQYELHWYSRWSGAKG